MWTRHVSQVEHIAPGLYSVQYSVQSPLADIGHVSQVTPRQPWNKARKDGGGWRDPAHVIFRCREAIRIEKRREETDGLNSRGVLLYERRMHLYPRQPETDGP